MSQNISEIAEAQESTGLFTGLEVYSPDNELALATIDFRLQELSAISEPTNDEVNERRLFGYQQRAVLHYLGKWHPGYEPAGDYGEINTERRALKDLGYTDYYLDPSMILPTRAAEARWKLSGLDPETLANPESIPDPRQAVEAAWVRASREILGIKLADLRAQLAVIVAEQVLNMVTVNDTQAWEALEARRLELDAKAKRIQIK
jgi:hypothetical protein